MEVRANRILNYTEVITHGYQRGYFDSKTVEREFKKPILARANIFMEKDNNGDSFPDLRACYKKWKKER